MTKGLVALAAIVVAASIMTACGSTSFEDTNAGQAVGPEGVAAGGTTPVNGDAATAPSANDGGASSTSPTEADAAPPEPKVVVSNESVQVWGAARTFVLVAPKDVVPGKSLPVVFVFHGDGGNGAGMRAGFALDGQSADGAIVVYPDGKDASWDLYTPEASNADNAFVDAMLEALKARFAIDTTRIFGSGYSSGAFFVNQLACRRTGLFRAIAPNAGGAPQEPQDPAASVWPGTTFTKCANQTGGVAALVMHGSDDYVVGTKSGTYDARYWAHVNGCDSTEDARIPATPAPCVQHASCPADRRVVYCEIAGIGHGIWSESVKATWAFFAAQ